MDALDETEIILEKASETFVVFTKFVVLLDLKQDPNNKITQAISLINQMKNEITSKRAELEQLDEAAGRWLSIHDLKNQQNDFVTPFLNKVAELGKQLDALFK